ncbi:MAG: DNA helicase RecG [Candidatus Buchananbacteria bacterium CG10_big_fil_rev_8_21_14_0_10_42_9]|uniref:ATP-dependent DNA helicase RecG n=1 Tax=Candidatus Buchananbacteria bacterium CG10_big_fil_rev_8_21_14_0_10_42_9 TaxID=1974526 RepID=A0A2H0W0R8_9BACT|nr:MAG: DNA helicase RecG [Candidatus Buchananbacteria bacterium CG10_big_fil_rev_8_21_14_0_10_42_9]
MAVDFNTSVEKLTSVGQVTARRLKHLGISTAEDLLYYFPFRYDDYSKVFLVKNLTPGEQATVKIKIELLDSRRSFRKKTFITESLVSDESGSIKVIWFNQKYISKVLHIGDEVYLSGKVALDKAGVYLANPTYENVKKEITTHTARLVPIYPVTSNLTQKQIRFLVSYVLPLAEKVDEWLPPAIISDQKFMRLDEAIAAIHFPKNLTDQKQALKRLKFNELFLLQLQVLQTKNQMQAASRTPIEFKENRIKEFVGSLPFDLTDDQRKVSWQIIQDMSLPKPMNRLLQGDVGAGKTVVAAMVAFNCVLNGYQVVLMAPTEVLAKQHFLTLQKIFGTKLRIGLLSRSQKAYASEITGAIQVTKAKLLSLIKKGEVDLVIGTHALIQDDVFLPKIGLVVIDEQHRFGVAQRKILKEKSQDNELPHFLSMTATPIPRSLYLTLYGDLDISVIKQMPKDRKPIVTKLVTEENRGKAYEFILKNIKAGRQAFVICPLIDPSDKLGVKAVTEEYEKLNQEVFPTLKIGLLHGKLPAKEKDKVMQEFSDGKLAIIVSTSVVEVGVDVPNATVMMIEGAERFGLAQLHQFRGRVGRSHHQSFCFLFTDQKSPKVIERLKVMTNSNDGFVIAEKDLEFRGAGQVYGIRQSGYFEQLNLASFYDVELIELAKKHADRVLSNDPNLKNHSKLAQKLQSLTSAIHFE